MFAADSGSGSACLVLSVLGRSASTLAGSDRIQPLKCLCPGSTRRRHMRAPLTLSRIPLKFWAHAPICLRRIVAFMIEVQRQPDGRARLNVTGPMRLAESAELLEHARALAAGGGAIELDLSRAEHLHSGCLQILRALERQLSAAGTTFSVVAASDAARDALQLCGLSWWIEKGKVA